MYTNLQRFTKYIINFTIYGILLIGSDKMKLYVNEKLVVFNNFGEENNKTTLLKVITL